MAARLRPRTTSACNTDKKSTTIENRMLAPEGSGVPVFRKAIILLPANFAAVVSVSLDLQHSSSLSVSHTSKDKSITVHSVPGKRHPVFSFLYSATMQMMRDP